MNIEYTYSEYDYFTQLVCVCVLIVWKCHCNIDDFVSIARFINEYKNKKNGRNNDKSPFISLTLTVEGDSRNRIANTLVLCVCVLVFVFRVREPKFIIYKEFSMKEKSSFSEFFFFLWHVCMYVYPFFTNVWLKFDFPENIVCLIFL